MNSKDRPLCERRKRHGTKVKNSAFCNFMQIAIDVAEKQIEDKKRLKHEPEIPIGCVIVNNKTNKIIAKSCNKTMAMKNPLKHAEIVCINRAMKKLKTNRLTGCSLYVTLEPCAMCASAIMLAKIDRVYIGCLSPKTGAIISNLHIYKRTICNHVPDVYYCIMEEECRALLRGFFRDA
ncbi:MAG: nucleoside deaminase [Rickettsiales bacterium]|nr:nucleoside deaminase [Rickettsiales bacterium]